MGVPHAPTMRSDPLCFSRVLFLDARTGPNGQPVPVGEVGAARPAGRSVLVEKFLKKTFFKISLDNKDKS